MAVMTGLSAIQVITRLISSAPSDEREVALSQLATSLEGIVAQRLARTRDGKFRPAVELLRGAVRDRAPGVDVLASLRDVTLRLVDARHPLSGVNDRSVPFFRTVAASPALVGRAREIAAELERTLAEELERDPTFRGDATLLAAFFVAGYATVLVATARRLIAGEPPSAVVDDHRARFERLFEALRAGVAPQA